MLDNWHLCPRNSVYKMQFSRTLVLGITRNDLFTGACFSLAKGLLHRILTCLQQWFMRARMRVQDRVPRKEASGQVGGKELSGYSHSTWKQNKTDGAKRICNGIPKCLTLLCSMITKTWGKSTIVCVCPRWCACHRQWILLDTCNLPLCFTWVCSLISLVALIPDVH